MSDNGTSNIYGRGIYFWELEEDAEAYGKRIFKENAAIVKSKFIATRKNSVIWNSRYKYQSPDTIARNLIQRGIKVVIIPNDKIEDTTFTFAKGDALCYLVDLYSS